MSREKRGRVRRRLIWFAVFAVLAIGAFGAAAALGAASELRAARAELTTAEARAKALELEPARVALEAADAHLQRARAKIRSFPLKVAGLVPYLGRSVRAADNLTAAADEVIAGATEALAAAELLPQQGRFRVRNGRLPKIDWDALEETSTAAAARFEAAETLAQEAPSSGVISIIAEARAEILDGVAEAKETAARLASGARVLPTVLGERGPQRHLVVIQNAAEARATGGAIEAAMLLRATDRDLDLLSSDPDELAFGAPGDRDRSHRLNLDADFAVSARRIADTYRQVTGETPDTVIALDADALAAILRVAGPVTVDGVRLTGNTLVPFLSRDIFKRYRTEVEQGIFLGRTSSAMWDRVTGGNLPMRKLLEQLGAAARAKHIQLWARDDAVQRTFEELSVSGAPPRASDGGAVVGVTANSVGLAELDWYARRTVRYHLHIDPDGATRARLDVTLRNTATLDRIPRTVRAKQPNGTLTHDVTAWLGAAPHRFTLAAGPKERARNVVEDSFRITPGEVRVLIWRAPGLRPDEVEVTIELPDGARPRDLPTGMIANGSTLRWKGSPDTDLELVVRY